ncbi:RING-H2 finger protein ATL34 [Cardamine amara subsp. amara]|uniref:RING-H2 finger protein ATL34 n=1 Tax=Cardamine amara subsp. amara TaxID=228776 RepID=A0ABD1BUM8_CARAN
MTSRLGNLQLYKFDVPYLTDVGVILVSQLGIRYGIVIPLTGYTGQRLSDLSKAGLSQEFEDVFRNVFFDEEKDCNITDHIFSYLASNFTFKDLVAVPPTCPVLVFHFQIREHYQDPAPQGNITPAVLSLLNIDECFLDVENAALRLTPIAPTTTKILDCYQGRELCCICEKGFPKEEELVFKTVCNHIFHATCISTHLLVTPRCPVCSKDLPPVDIRTLLF